MDFTQLYKQSSFLVAFSPGAQFILTAVQDRIIVRRADSFQITQTWLSDPEPAPSLTKLKSHNTATHNRWVTNIGWSCDSEYILAACAKSNVVHVWKLRDQDWTARIDAGAEGLLRAEWAPDGRTILCFSEWGLRVTVWSLVTSAAVYIQFPIHPDRGYTFRSDGRYFILAERHKSKDTIGIYDTQEAYRLVRHFPLPTTSLSSLTLSPTGNHLAVWEGPLEFKLHVLSLAGDRHATFIPDLDPGYGVRNAVWHPTGSYLAVAGWEDKIYILDALSWSPVCTLEISGRIPSGATLWREPSRWLENEGRGFLSYERLSGPQTITVTRPDPLKVNLRSSAFQVEWNKTGSLLLVRWGNALPFSAVSTDYLNLALYVHAENAPNAVHLYSFPSPSSLFTPTLRSILVHSKPILHARWNPVRKGSLALCCGTRSIYTWSDEWVVEGGEGRGQDEEMAECVAVPAKKFETRDLRWAPDGRGLVLMDKDMFCCAFEVQEEPV